ncbi:hypothetical protein DBR06_SOUSAS2710046, partial [Sousa chinensis]
SSQAPPHPCPCSLPHSLWSPGGSFAPYQTPEPIAVGLKARYAPVQAHGERTWVCDNEECSQAISRNYPGRCHILIHMGEQLFILQRKPAKKKITCEVCQKTFKQRGEGKQHVKTRVPERNVCQCPREDHGGSYATCLVSRAIFSPCLSKSTHLCVNMLAGAKGLQ